MTSGSMRSQLLAMSFDTPASPWITLCSDASVKQRAAGWGLAWYPGDDNAAVVIKDPEATRDTSLTETIGDWERFRSTVFLCHLRGAAKRVTQQDTHPFVRSHAGRNFIFAHSGDLVHSYRDALPLGDNPVYEPIGLTDSEHAFCWLLTQLRERHARRFAEFGWENFYALLREIDYHGTANLLVTDGDHFVAYRDESGFSELHHQRRVPPHTKQILSNSYVELDLSDPRDHGRTMILVSTTPLDDGAWQPIEPGAMIVCRRAQIVWRSAAVPAMASHATVTATASPVHSMPAQLTDPASAALLDAAMTPAATVTAPAAARAREVSPPSDSAFIPLPSEREAVLNVTHETIYSYDTPVEYSTHTLRLHPAHDLRQEVLDCQVELSPTGRLHRYEDVFGNHSLDLEISTPYTELRVASRFQVCVAQRRDIRDAVGRVTLPLVWMPWQRQMMSPYLLPSELPETELRELSEFAMSFARRQDHDLVETLVDINQTIYRDFRYISGSTTVATTPFQVYAQRRGVCQDFANLFICLARLLNVPARYRVGYINTGGNYENKIQSDASHAWTEVYLPGIGWRGFDPTNGCLAGLDHIRVAVGRNFRDATPTSGTIYRGGTGEKLRVSVKVERR